MSKWANVLKTVAINKDLWAYELRFVSLTSQRGLGDILYYAFIVLLTVIDSVYMLRQSLSLSRLTLRDVSKVWDRDIAIFSLEISWTVINHWVPQAKYTPLAIFYTRAMAL